MRIMEEALRKIKSVLKVPGDGIPEVELKFRIGDSPEIQKALSSLVDNQTLNKYEFPPNSGSWHYKLKKKIDLDDAGDDEAPSAGGGAGKVQLDALSAIVEEIAKEIGDDFILNKVKDYKTKFKL